MLRFERVTDVHSLADQYRGERWVQIACPSCGEDVAVVGGEGPQLGAVRFTCPHCGATREIAL